MLNQSPNLLSVKNKARFYASQRHAHGAVRTGPWRLQAPGHAICLHSVLVCPAESWKDPPPQHFCSMHLIIFSDNRGFTC